MIKALSVRQPWAHAIVHLGKDVENRPRVHSYRGPLLIHASAGMTDQEYFAALDFMSRAATASGSPIGPIPAPAMIERGGIVGIVDLVDAVRESDSRWWMGPCGLVLANARPLPFTPCRGTVAPLIWTPDDATLATLAPFLPTD